MKNQLTTTLFLSLLVGSTVIAYPAAPAINAAFSAPNERPETPTEKDRFNRLVSERWTAEQELRRTQQLVLEYAYSPSPPLTVMAEYENALSNSDRLDRKLLNLHILHGWETPDFTAAVRGTDDSGDTLFVRAQDRNRSLRSVIAMRIAGGLPARAPLPHDVDLDNGGR